jgi:hypothetical protein
MKLLLVVCLMSFGTFAKVETFNLSVGNKVTLNVPEKWETAKDLFGIPLAVLGPWANESRPVLSIVPTGVKASIMPQKDFQNLFNNFKKEKEEWVRSHKGELLGYEPTKSAELRKDLKGHFIGAEFKINNVHFIERSYYLYCKDELFNLKYSIRDEHRKYIKDLQKMVEEFKCE